jgi:DNA-binding MarR family transcriptional regulator
MPTHTGLADTVARLRRAMRRGARVADPANTLAVAQFELLASVADHPGIRPSHLAKLLNLRPNTVTTLVNALTAQDMIDRAAAGGDGRAVALTVTDTGRHAVHAWQATNNAVLNLALSTLTAAQRTALTKAIPALDALAVAIDRLADAPPIADPTAH